MSGLLHSTKYQNELINSMTDGELELCKRAYFAHRRACRIYNICASDYTTYAVEWVDARRREAGLQLQAPFEYEQRDYERQFAGTAAMGFGMEPRKPRKPANPRRKIDPNDFQE